MRPRLLCLLTILFVLAACGGEAEPVPSGGDEPLVLVEYSSGLGAPAGQWALPAFALLADGTAISQARDDGIVLSGSRRTLSASDMTELYRQAGAAELFRSREFRLQVLDGSVLVVRIRSAEGEYETSLDQPDVDEGGDRGRIARFAHAAPLAGQAAGPYVPDRVAAIVVGEDGGDSADVRPWPLTVPATEMPGYPARPCLVLAGAGASSLLATVRTATGQTRWSAGGRLLSLRIRPLLPHERDCADLEH